MSAVAPHRHRPDIAVPCKCRALIERGALVAVNHSGGKDSQAMTFLLSRIVPREQLLVVHAPLGEVEWPGTVEHIERTIPPSVPFARQRKALFIGNQPDHTTTSFVGASRPPVCPRRGYWQFGLLTRGPNRVPNGHIGPWCRPTHKPHSVNETVTVHYRFHPLAGTRAKTVECPRPWSWSTSSIGWRNRNATCAKVRQSPSTSARKGT